MRSPSNIVMDNIYTIYLNVTIIMLSHLFFFFFFCVCVCGVCGDKKRELKLKLQSVMKILYGCSKLNQGLQNKHQLL